MSGSPVVAAHSLVVEAVDALTEAAGPAATADEALSVLTVCEGVVRQLDRLVVSVVADLVRRGVFTERGYRDAVTALADLLGWDRAEARRRVSAAEQVCPRTGLDGSPLPARLPATAEKFAGGAASLRHVDVISRVLASPAARRLAAEVWAGAEVELAGHAEQYAPAELLEWGSRLVDTLDQDGPEPNDRPPDPPPWIDPLRRPPPPTTPSGLRSRRIGDPHPDRRPAAARARNSRTAPRRCWPAPVDRRLASISTAP